MSQGSSANESTSTSVTWTWYDSLKTFCNKLVESDEYMDYLWKNKYVRIVLVTGGILTARKVLDLVRRKWYRLPPGPVGIPFFGMAHKFANFDYATNSCQLYGPIYLTHMGFSQICVINDFNLLSKYFGKKEFSDRKDKITSYERPLTVITNKGDDWNIRRKLMKNNVVSPLNSKVLSLLIDKCVKKHIFPIIDDCVNNNQIWDVRPECNYITFASIYGSTFGAPCPSPTDERFLEYCQIVKEAFSCIVREYTIFVFFPAKIHYMLQPFIGFAESRKKRYNLIREWIKSYEIRNVTNMNSDEQIDASDSHGIYYDTLKTAIKNGIMTEEKAIADIQTSFSAGMHTTSVALEQCVLFLAKCGKNLQNELFNEVKPYMSGNDDVDGGDNSAYNMGSTILKNRNKLHKVSSFIYESLRMHGVISVTLFRYLRDQDEKIRLDNGKEYIIPKNTIIMGNVNGINHSQEYWQDKGIFTNDNNNVFQFNPTRFIDPNTHEFVRKTNLATFGAGRRNCAGQELAMKELYLVMTMLIQRYEFSIPPNYKSKDDFIIPRKFLNSETPMLGVSVSLRERA